MYSFAKSIVPNFKIPKILSLKTPCDLQRVLLSPHFGIINLATMVLSSPLVRDKVWLDKPKYDEAERRYYVELAKSIALAKSGVGSTSTNDSVIPNESDLITEEVCIKSEELDVKAGAIEPNDKTIPKEVCELPTGTSVCNKTNKAAQVKHSKEDISPNESTTSPICIPPKPDLPQKSEDKFKKTKVLSKSSKNTQASPVTNSVGSGTESSGQITEVCKLKGYFLNTKSPLIPPDGSLNKGTNVNTIPQFPDLNPCHEKSTVDQNVKKVNQLKRVPTLDKQESTELIIPTNGVSEPSLADDQAKKESKKKKRNKKERWRDKKGVTQNTNSWNSLAGEVAKARQHIKNSLQCIDDIAITSNTVSVEVANRVISLEKENHELTSRMEKLEQRIAMLEKQLQQTKMTAAAATPVCKKPAPQPPKPAPAPADEEDDGVDLFASESEEEDAEAAKIKEQRLAEYAAKKSKKPTLIAKSSIILDVKPWDDETDMKKLEEEVRKIGTDGLLWGASKLVPLAYGIHKLQISCVVEDEKVSVDWLQETIQEIEDYVQSVDIAAFNKI